ncbi:MAG: hypothetical protein OXC60_05355 [Litoreibacter sp.]|nr:hypothetical protein [Litoreibacter sp.]
MKQGDEIRGMIVTSEGDRIPTVVTFHTTVRVKDFSQAARLDVPEPWADEYAQNPSNFHFVSNDGEVFSQIHVLDRVGPVDEEEWFEGRIYLLRQPVVPFSVAAASLMAGQPTSVPQYAGE